jgi:uncharacterized protein YjgD (DUF1641 family)
MMALLKSPEPIIKNQNCKVKHLKIFEKDVIRNVIGNDSEIPQTIYNRIQDKLSKGKNVNAILKLKTDDGCSYWTINRFEPSINNNFKSQFTVDTKLTNRKCIDNTRKLYKVLSKIESSVSVDYANKYLEGFLEEKCIEFNEIANFCSN